MSIKTVTHCATGEGIIQALLRGRRRASHPPGHLLPLPPDPESYPAHKTIQVAGLFPYATNVDASDEVISKIHPTQPKGVTLAFVKDKELDVFNCLMIAHNYPFIEDLRRKPRYGHCKFYL
ncbi:hypothetical protein IWQ60_000905 [Tieghemiomyces parasiticus]|uniref:Glycylpeptide N-tetradecanoyltransferase C-terminal domain-containing protein n=1 Tax=Tieghemiomyces parasiticus TaxID=78921 RepID=A0A9W8E2E5_9FUNG|nr:hypothetical protein IWQ60_000905 [Tieghemiomyces parasiticus]